MLDDAQIEAAAAQVRAIYCDCRTRWHRTHDNREVPFGVLPIPRYDGGENGTGTRYKPVWPRLASTLVARGIDPRAYMEAHFRNRTGHPPEPAELLGERALAVFRALDTRGLEQLRRVFDFQKGRFLAELDKLLICKVRHGWSDEQVLRSVLSNALTELSALFRCAVAERYGLVDLVEAYREEAFAQYLGRRHEYESVWGSEWVPEEFRTRAREMVRKAAQVVGVAAPTRPPARHAGRARTSESAPAESQPNLRRIRPME